jgi:hypothetical protein
LSVAIELLMETAQESGIDVDALVPEGDEALESHVETEVRRHTLVREATEYMKLVGEWFESSDGCLNENPGEADLSDYEQVILRYHTLIWTKISRAVRQLFEPNPTCPADLTKDADGSAKVALIAIDRSIAAWWRMRGQFPEQKGSILKFLVLLARLKEATEHAFVNARDFVRPGFDEGNRKIPGCSFVD